MEIHHSRHHQTYINNLNAALADLPELAALSVEELLARFDSLPAKVQGRCAITAAVTPTTACSGR